jgi:DNA-binding HxlR family transcriptional regulator
MLGNRYEDQDCSIARALEVIGERWSLMIVRDALFGVRRFSDFEVHLDIPKAVLSQRLSGLIKAGVLERTPDPDHKGRFLYTLTDTGLALWPVVHSLARWGRQFCDPGTANRDYTHALCGTELDLHAGCPKCGVTPPPQDVIALRRAHAKQPRTDRVSEILRDDRRLLEPV